MSSEGDGKKDSKDKWDEVFNQNLKNGVDSTRGRDWKEWLAALKRIDGCVREAG